MKKFYLIAALIVVPGAGAWFFNGLLPSFNPPRKAPANEFSFGKLRMAEGWEISYYAPPSLGVESPRQLSPGEDGWIFAATYSDKIYAMRDSDGDGVADEVRTVLSDLKTPRGVLFWDGDLYAGAIDGIYRAADVMAQMAGGGPISATLHIGGFIDSKWHSARYMKVGADGMLYVSLGTPCNICIPPDPEMSGVIRRYPLEGGEGEVYAEGIRNSAGFDFHPQTGDLWFTDNGRDFLGDELPSDELNHAPRPGMHFGFPYCHEKDFPDPEYGDFGDCADYEPAVLLTGPHVANLGMAFDESGQYAYIALHGSWNRSEKIGYGVWRAALDGNGGVSSYEPFAEGWLAADESVFGRPADVMVLNGDVYISDDFANAVYRASRL